MKKKLIYILLIFSNLTLLSQVNTLGTISLTEEAYDGYTLFSSHKNTFLINNCGQVINQWSSDYLPGHSVYILPNGNLIRAGRKGPSTITFGGVGGIVEMFDWDGNLVWEFVYSSDDYRLHHDIYPMPNGNILVLAATVMSNEETILAGRDPNLVSGAGILYNEQILEIKPIGTNDYSIEWEWNFNDHLIQDFDDSKNNYGVISEHPEKLDINFLNDRIPAENWLHVNSIQYDETLNQIVISSRNLSELYIIDHSTTTEEAAGETGGTYGKGWLNGTQSHLEFLPERATDFIFAVYCEDFGFVGVLVLFMAYALVVIRSIVILYDAQDTFSRLLGGAIIFTFVSYVFVNIGMVVGLLPVVGVPLPLISYGGTSMLTILISVGVVLSINMNKNKI